MFQRLTFDNISILMLGIDTLSLSIDFPNVAYKNAFDDVEEMIFRRHFKPETLWKLQRWLQIGGEKKLTKSLKVFDEFIYQSIATKRQELINRSSIENKDDEEANNLDNILTSYMKQLKEKQGQVLLGCYANSDKFLRDTSLNLMVAGRDTVAAALTWFFWLVSTHPFVETKILEEIREMFAEKHDKNSRFLSTKEVNKLVYLHATLCETLRLYPPIPINHRASSNADILPSGHHLKKNQRILLYFYSMGRMEEIWGVDCLEFKPERWVSYDGDQRRLVYVPPYKFTAYNAGPQTCVGKGMSLIEMKMVAANMLWNYRVEVVEGHPVSPTLSILLYMKYGLKVMISRRCG